MKSPIEKNKEYIVDIIDNGFEGEGIAKIEDFTIFVQNAIKGEKIKILIVKVLSSYAYGKIIEIIKSSEERIESDCNTYKRCGGCNLRHVKYEYTLKIKQNSLQNLVNKNLKQKIQVEKVIGMENPYNYRNKAQYPVGINKEKEAVLRSICKQNTWNIPIEKCFIQNSQIEEIAKFIFEYIVKNKISIYNETTGKGLIRHIVMKIGIKTNEIMCILVINGNKIPKQEELIKEITKKYPEVKTIVNNINTKNTNVILGEKNVNIYGSGYITDKLGEYTFKISPLSFYQVNPIQAEKLYRKAVEGARNKKYRYSFWFILWDRNNFNIYV